MKRFEAWHAGAATVLALWSWIVTGCSQQGSYADGGDPPRAARGPVAAVDDIPAPRGLPATGDRLGTVDDADEPVDESVAVVSGTVPADAGAAAGEAAGVAMAGGSATGSVPDVAAPPATIEVPSDVALAKPGQEPLGARYREPLFVDWPEPSVAIMLTGRQYGYLEPCGCSGLDNQNGGLVRRSTLLKQLREKGWNVVPVDAGNQVRRFGRQAEIKYQITIEGLRSMGYQAIGFGPDDLRLPAEELVGVIDPETFVCANVKIFGEDSFAAPYRVFQQGDKKVGLTMVLGERDLQQIINSDITTASPTASLKQVWPELQQARCDLYILVAHASIEESQELARAFPQFQVIITTGGAGEPTREPVAIEGTRSLMIEVGTKGMFAGVLALFDDAARPLRYQRVPLDARFPDSQEMLQLLAAYQDQLKAAGFEGLGITSQPLPGDSTFVGSAVCNDCHDKEYKIWKEGVNGHGDKHSHAYATLQQPPNSRGGIPRNFDPECISCHVVGWNPQKYFPYQSGFVSLETTPELINVGCENCHGPGSRHVAAENGDLEVDDDELDRLREQMWLALEDAEQKCLDCHDLDNSPAFQEEGAFEEYWNKIAH